MTTLEQKESSSSSMRKNLLALLFSIGLTLVFLELGLRWVQIDQPKPIEKPKENWALIPERVWIESHPELGWFHQKNKMALQKVVDKTVTIHTDSQGFRGTREYPLERAGGVRLLAVGDSFVFGFGVEDSEVFTARLEAMQPGLEVPNLAVAGYGIDQIYKSYQIIGRPYKPDLVLIGIYPEDFWRATRAFSDSGHAKPYFSLKGDGSLELHNVPVPPPFTLDTHQFPDLIEWSPTQTILRQSALYRLVQKQLIRLGKNTGILDPDLTVEWQVGKAILRKFIQEIREDGATPLVLIAAPRQWVQEKEPFSLHKSLLRFLKKEKVDYIDFTPVFQERMHDPKDIETYYMAGDWHWSPAGHAVVAEHILEYLKSHQRLP